MSLLAKHVPSVITAKKAQILQLCALVVIIAQQILLIPSHAQLGHLVAALGCNIERIVRLVLKDGMFEFVKTVINSYLIIKSHSMVIYLRCILDDNIA